MSPASSHTRPYGHLAQGRVRQRSGRVRGDHRSCCAAMTSTPVRRALDDRRYGAGSGQRGKSRGTQSGRHRHQWWPGRSSIHPAHALDSNHHLTRSDYDDIRAFLNICELIAVGVNKGAFSKSVSEAYWGDVIPEAYQTAKQLVNNIRTTPGEGSRYTYVNLEKLAKRWAKRTKKATKLVDRS